MLLRILLLSFVLLANTAHAATNKCMRYPSGTPVNCVDSSSGGGSSIGGAVTGGHNNDILFINPTGVLAQDDAFKYNSSTNTIQVRNIYAGPGNDMVVQGANPDEYFTIPAAGTIEIQDQDGYGINFVSGGGDVNITGASINILGTLSINSGMVMNSSSITDSVNSVGTSGQFLKSLGGAVVWATVSGSANAFSIGEIPSGTVNGSNVTFTIAHTPVANTVGLYVNGQRLKKTTDYTISSATITMIVAPQTGDLLLADYQY